MEICLYPYFLSPGDDMCFTHYESFSPFLSPKAKENEQTGLTESTLLDSFDGTRHIRFSRNTHEKVTAV